MHDLRDNTACVAGNVTVTGCEAHLKHSMLLDLASLGLRLMPPKGLFPSKAPKQAPSHSQAISAPNGGRSKRKPAVKVTRVTVGVSKLVLGYQTAVEVTASEHAEGGALTLFCTECITLQELAGEAVPHAFKGSLQLNNLTVSHKETRVLSLPASPSAAPHHALDILCAAHFSVQADPACQVQGTTMPSHTEHSPNLASTRKSAVSSPPDGQGLSSLPCIAVTTAMTGWHSVFHADAAIALCKTAVDFTSVARQTAIQLHPKSTGPSGLESHAQLTEAVAPVEAAAPAAKAPAAAAAKAPDDHRHALVMTQLTQLQKLPSFLFTLQVTNWRTDVVVAHHIVWGLALQEVQCRVDSGTLVAVQQQHLHSQLTSTQPQHQNSSSESSSHIEDPLAGINSQGPSGNSAPGAVASSSPKAAEGPRLILRQVAVSLNSKALLEVGELEASLDLWPGVEKQAGVGQSSASQSNSPRRQASLGEGGQRWE